MKEVAKLQIKDRTELFQATAISMGMQPNVIEKDFWVCFMLDHLFHDCKYKNAFVFKGGTSLSKSYHVIERFSEDIDLILDWRKIINDEVNPWEERSKTKQDLFNKQINSEAAKFYKEELIPQLNVEMKEKLDERKDLKGNSDAYSIWMRQIVLFYTRVYENFDFSVFSAYCRRMNSLKVSFSNMVKRPLYYKMWNLGFLVPNMLKPYYLSAIIKIQSYR